MMTNDELLDAFRQMTLLELSEFVRQFEETFGVTALQPAGPPPPPPAVTRVEDEEPDEFDVILQAAGDKKIQVIKEVRVLTKLGLKEAKDLVDQAPSVVLEKADREAAERARAALAGAGAEVVLRLWPGIRPWTTWSAARTGRRTAPGCAITGTRRRSRKRA